jgi:uncharacterized protein (TIGR02453 family)
MARSSHFAPALFAFLRDLRRHNNREWFTANRDRYETVVKAPALAFIADFAAPLAAISPSFVAEPKAVGGSLFRIHRDTRFAKGEPPYKTHVGIQFRHELSRRDAHAPGYYLHLEPGECFVAVGLWQPDKQPLGRIRRAIAADGQAWKAASRAKRFAARYALWGGSLKRVPPGFPADHPFVDDIKRKDFVAVADLDEATVCRPGFLDTAASTYRLATPFMRFLCEAVGASF